MAHIHKVYDNDAHFKIDGVTRAVKNASETKTMLVQHDHNSERFTFEVPRVVDGHDMSTCNVVQVHYINIDSKNKMKQNTGVYEVDDLQISPDSNDVVIFSWLVSVNATQYVGSLNFIVRFVCSTGGAVDYAWNTVIHSGVSVSAGIFNSEDIVTEYPDVLAQFECRISALESGTGGSSGGLSTAAAEMLVSILREAQYSSDQSDNITKLAEMLANTTAKLATPVIRLEAEEKLATPVIRLEADTTAVLSVAVLGEMILGDNGGMTKLTAPIIKLVEV